MFREKCELRIDGQNILSEEVYSFEALELKRIIEVRAVPSLFFGVLPVRGVEIGSIEETPLYELEGVGGVLVEPVVHGVVEILHFWV